MIKKTANKPHFCKQKLILGTFTSATTHHLHAFIPPSSFPLCSVIWRSWRHRSARNAKTVVTTERHGSQPTAEEAGRQEKGRNDKAWKHRRKRQLAPVCVTVFYMYAVAFCHFSAFNFLPPSLSALLKTCNTVCSRQKKKKKDRSDWNAWLISFWFIQLSFWRCSVGLWLILILFTL